MRLPAMARNSLETTFRGHRLAPREHEIDDRDACGTRCRGCRHGQMRGFRRNHPAGTHVGHSLHNASHRAHVSAAVAAPSKPGRQKGPTIWGRIGKKRTVNMTEVEQLLRERRWPIHVTGSSQEGYTHRAQAGRTNKHDAEVSRSRTARSCGPGYRRCATAVGVRSGHGRPGQGAA